MIAFTRQADARWKPAEGPIGGGVCIAIPFDHLEMVMSGGELFEGQKLKKGEFIQHLVIKPGEPLIHIYIGKVVDSQTD